eukprot:scaffold1816_cov134-Isochrysis_galbana.AAC.3
MSLRSHQPEYGADLHGYRDSRHDDDVGHAEPPAALRLGAGRAARRRGSLVGEARGSLLQNGGGERTVRVRCQPWRRDIQLLLGLAIAAGGPAAPAGANGPFGRDQVVPVHPCGHEKRERDGAGGADEAEAGLDPREGDGGHEGAGQQRERDGVEAGVAL